MNGIEPKKSSDYLILLENLRIAVALLEDRTSRISEKINFLGKKDERPEENKK